jgi:hypothetical protein
VTRLDAFLVVILFPTFLFCSSFIKAARAAVFFVSVFRPEIRFSAGSLAIFCSQRSFLSNSVVIALFNFRRASLIPKYIFVLVRASSPVHGIRARQLLAQVCPTSPRCLSV